MAERILCAPQDRSNVDNLIDNNFRKAMAVSIMTIHAVEEYVIYTNTTPTSVLCIDLLCCAMPRRYEHHVGVFHYCYSVLTMKKRLGELVKLQGGACIQVCRLGR